jgi:hypothetical protein
VPILQAERLASALFALLVVCAQVPSACALDAPTPAGEDARTRATLEQLCTELNQPCNACGQHRQAGDTPGPKPTSPPKSDLLRHPIDAWGRSLQISVGGDGVLLRSAGADGELGTPDDLVRACGKAEESK